jgi:hypothetical protein
MRNAEALTRIDPAKGKAWQTLTSHYCAKETRLAQAAGCVPNKQTASRRYILLLRDCSVGLGTRGRSPLALFTDMATRFQW